MKKITPEIYDLIASREAKKAKLAKVKKAVVTKAQSRSAAAQEAEVNEYLAKTREALLPYSAPRPSKDIRTETVSLWVTTGLTVQPVHKFLVQWVEENGAAGVASMERVAPKIAADFRHSFTQGGGLNLEFRSVRHLDFKLSVELLTVLDRAYRKTPEEFAVAVDLNSYTQTSRDDSPRHIHELSSWDKLAAGANWPRSTKALTEVVARWRKNDAEMAKLIEITKSKIRK